MKIKHDLPQFKYEHALFVVTGDQSGALYHVGKGEIERIAELKEEMPYHSDREGFFQRRMQKGLARFSTFGVGAPSENNEERAQAEFLKSLNKEITHAIRKFEISTIHVFSPDYFLNKILDAIENEYKELIVSTFKGTFLKEHPFTLLKKVKEIHGQVQEAVKDQADMSQEARKLLNKGKIAREFPKNSEPDEKVKQFMERGRK